MDALMVWLHADPVRLYAVVGGGCLLAGVLLVWAARAGWRAGDPPYEATRKRKRQADPWDVDPTTGSLIVTPELREAGRRYQEGLVSDHTQVLRPPPLGPGETRRSLDPAWRRAILSPTGSWTMPNDGRRHHHRAHGSPGEATRRLHPGYVAEARARVARGEDPGELPD